MVTLIFLDLFIDLLIYQPLLKTGLVHIYPDCYKHEWCHVLKIFGVKEYVSVVISVILGQLNH